MISEREKLEFESLPEFIREPYQPVKEPYAQPSAVKRAYTPSKRSLLEDLEDEEIPLPKTAELEALWPGVNHDFLQAPRKTPSFYLSIGFLAGAVVSLLVCWIFAAFNHVPANVSKLIDKKIFWAGGTSKSNQAVPQAAAGDVIVPAYPTYEVKDGDTLAGIALQAYKRVSPRLLDEICRANEMRSAHVLRLGQKLILPEYRMQTSQATAGAPQ